MLLSIAKLHSILNICSLFIYYFGWLIHVKRNVKCKLHNDEPSVCFGQFLGVDQVAYIVEKRH